MRNSYPALLACAVLALAGLHGRAADLRPDADGYIRDWVMLAPIALPEGESCAEALLKEQIPNEATLRPRAGETLKVRGKDLTWQRVTARTNHFDFNDALNSIHDHVAGYAVAYVECEREIPEVVLAVASNDQGRLYFNGVDIYAFTEPRQLVLDADKGKVTLKKGLNVFVFKVTNEQNSWQGALRLLTKAGQPLRDVRIRLSP
jgi:hypothetical protein